MKMIYHYYSITRIQIETPGTPEVPLIRKPPDHTGPAEKLPGLRKPGFISIFAQYYIVEALFIDSADPAKSVFFV